jgi:hypothetical protein
MIGFRIDFLDATPGSVELEDMAVYSLRRLAGVPATIDEFERPPVISPRVLL